MSQSGPHIRFSWLMNTALDITYLDETDLKKIEKEGADKGKSLLWFLANELAEGKSKAVVAFMAVWRKFEYAIKLEDLMVAPQEGGDKGKSVLWLLAWTAMHGELANDAKNLLEEILGQMPCSISFNDLCAKSETMNQSIRNLLQKQGEWADKTYRLIIEKNTFFKGLQNHQNEKQFDDLKSLAQCALDSGYYNAFYDLAQFLIEKNAPEEEIGAAYALVPQKSRHYMQANLYLEKHFAQTTKQEYAALNIKCNEQAVRIQELEKELQKAKQTQDDKLDDIFNKFTQLAVTPVIISKMIDAPSVMELKSEEFHELQKQNCRS